MRLFFSLSLALLISGTPVASAYFKPPVMNESPAMEMRVLRSLPGWPLWIGRLDHQNLPPRLIATGKLGSEWPSWIAPIPWLQ